MEVIYNDGGRKNAGFKGSTGDCACRAISIISGKPYAEVYKDLNDLGKKERITKRYKKKGSARSGVRMSTLKKYMKSLGFEWTPTMFIGSGCKVHLSPDELPSGKIVVRVSGHLTAVINGVIHDTHDCSRGETRCVYGYWVKGAGEGIIKRGDLIAVKSPKVEKICRQERI